MFSLQEYQAATWWALCVHNKIVLCLIITIFFLIMMDHIFVDEFWPHINTFARFPHSWCAAEFPGAVALSQAAILPGSLIMTVFSIPRTLGGDPSTAMINYGICVLTTPMLLLGESVGEGLLISWSSMFVCYLTSVFLSKRCSVTWTCSQSPVTTGLQFKFFLIPPKGRALLL